jgi:hypothetical protein
MFYYLYAVSARAETFRANPLHFLMPRRSEKTKARRSPEKEAADDDDDEEEEGDDDEADEEEEITEETLTEEQGEELQTHLRTSTSRMGVKRLTPKMREWATQQFLENLNLRSSKAAAAEQGGMSGEKSDEENGSGDDNAIDDKPTKKRARRTKKTKVKHSAMAAKALGLKASSSEDDADDEDGPAFKKMSSSLPAGLWKTIVSALQASGGIARDATPSVVPLPPPLTPTRLSVTTLSKYVSGFSYFSHCNFSFPGAFS